MRDPQAEAEPCRTCGKPRGENIAGGTRCSACGRWNAIQSWIGASFAAASWAFMFGHGMAGASTVFLVALVAVPAAFTTAVLLHELAHAAVAVLLGQTVSRIVVGEGTAWLRAGRDPQVIVGSIVMGNGITLIYDARRAGHRRRSAVVLLAAPLASLLLAAAAWHIGSEWPLAGRAASVICAVAHLVVGVITLVPVPTFGGRVWSDLAVVLFLARADEATLREYRVLAMRDRLQHLLEIGDGAAALATARAGAELHRGSSLAAALLAYVLHHQGNLEEAAAVARAAVEGADSAAERAYFTPFLGTDVAVPRNAADVLTR